MCSHLHREHEVRAHWCHSAVELCNCAVHMRNNLCSYATMTKYPELSAAHRIEIETSMYNDDGDDNDDDDDDDNNNATKRRLVCKWEWF